MKRCGKRQYNCGRSAWIGILCLMMGCGASPVFGMMASATGFVFRPVDGRRVRMSVASSLIGQYGDMTYAIQGPESGGWKSELEWPIQDIVYGGGVVSTTVLDRFQVNIGGWKSLNTNSGTMKDRDWFDNLRDLLMTLYGDDTAIYGEFDTTFDALKFDGNLRVEVLRRSSLTLGLLAGYAYTEFEWITGDGFQESQLSAYNVGSITGSGITYAQQIQVPYLGLAISARTETFPAAVNLYVQYSPIAHCEDVDDHVVRNKESIGVTQGTFLSFGSDISIYLHPSWEIAGTVNYGRYDLEGTQDQIFYDGPNAGSQFSNIDMTVTGRQLALGILIRYSF